MSRINDKMGLKPAGKRDMMKLPADRELRNAVTSAQCPKCHQWGARLSKAVPGSFWCTWCSHYWPLERAEKTTDALPTEAKP